jgi:hypothetical protein
LIQDSQDQLLRHNFIQQLPKILQGKINQSNNKHQQNGKRYPIPDKDKENHNKEIVTDSDKSHLCWRMKEGKNFAQVFYPNQQKCPMTKEGKLICMKLFLQGLCDKSCLRAHNYLQKTKRHLTTL